jgi:hypothetical protein
MALLKGITMLNKLQQLQAQTKLWLWYGRLTPIFFLVGATALYQIYNTTIPAYFYASWIIFITSGFIWWTWVIKVLMDLIRLFHDIHEHIGFIHDSIKEVKEDVKFLDGSRKD